MIKNDTITGIIIFIIECEDQINNYITAIIILSVLLTGIIVILMIAVYKLRKGDSFMFFKFESEEAGKICLIIKSVYIVI